MRGLTLGDLARRQLLWAAFAALWLVAWRTALVLVVATGLTWAACRVSAERRARAARRRARRLPPTWPRVPVGFVGRSAQPLTLVYGPLQPRVFMGKWPLTCDELRRAEKAKWS